jgi:hypothetical protein
MNALHVSSDMGHWLCPPCAFCHDPIQASSRTEQAPQFLTRGLWCCQSCWRSGWRELWLVYGREILGQLRMDLVEVAN